MQKKALALALTLGLVLSLSILSSNASAATVNVFSGGPVIPFGRFAFGYVVGSATALTSCPETLTITAVMGAPVYGVIYGGMNGHLKVGDFVDGNGNPLTIGAINGQFHTPVFFYAFVVVVSSSGFCGPDAPAGLIGAVMN